MENLLIGNTNWIWPSSRHKKTLHRKKGPLAPKRAPFRRGRVFEARPAQQDLYWCCPTSRPPNEALSRNSLVCWQITIKNKNCLDWLISADCSKIEIKVDIHWHLASSKFSVGWGRARKMKTRRVQSILTLVSFRFSLARPALTERVWSCTQCALSVPVRLTWEQLTASATKV